MCVGVCIVYIVYVCMCNVMYVAVRYHTTFDHLGP
jgi:hypothetical protein